jgi:hypothetical protein
MTLYKLNIASRVRTKLQIESPLCRAKFANVSHFAVSATALADFWLHDFNKGAVCPGHHQVVQELFGTKRSILFVTSAKLKCSRVILFFHD